MEREVRDGKITSPNDKIQELVICKHLKKNEKGSKKLKKLLP